MRYPFKRILTVVAAVFVLGLAPPAVAAVDSYTIGVDGMACPFCAYGIEKKLKAVNGVGSLDIRIKQGEVDVMVGDGGTVTPSELKKAIEEAGFGIRDLTVTGTAEVKKADGTVRAIFSDDFALPVRDYEGDAGELTLTGTVVHKGGEWRLTGLEKVE